MQKILKVQAGAKAIQEIKEKGFAQNMVKMMLGASGGPKWLILTELDKYLVGEFFEGRNTPLHLLGSSIGSWRFACYARKNPLEALETFKTNYVNFAHEYINKGDVKKDRELFTNLTKELLNSFTGKTSEGLSEIINSPIFKINFIAAGSKGLLNSEQKLPLFLGLTAAALVNMLSRKGLKYFFKRAMFYSDDQSPFYNINDLPTERIQLSSENLSNALFSSGSIPLGTYGIKGLSKINPDRVYRDGGIIDYHFNIKTELNEGIILYPHFYDFALPGWFDKITKTRKVSPENYERVVMISPGEELIRKLPYQKIPDRKDFEKMDFETRVKYWNKVVDLGKYIVEDFHEMIVKEDIFFRLKPFKA